MDKVNDARATVLGSDSDRKLPQKLLTRNNVRRQVPAPLMVLALTMTVVLPILVNTVSMKT